MASLVKNNDYYRQLIVNHFSQPQNKGLLKTNNSYHFHHCSSSCVDDFWIEMTFNHEMIVTAARFEGVGCAISTAAIDLFCQAIINQSLPQVVVLNQNYQAMLAEKPFDSEKLADLIAFQNVLKQPMRLRCALIISEAINQILKQVIPVTHE